MSMQNELEQRIQRHPEELLTVFRDINTKYEEAKVLKKKDIKMALHILNQLVYKIQALQNVPLASVPVTLHVRSNNPHIYHVLQKERDQPN